MALRDYMDIVLRRGWIILLVAVVAGMGAFGVSKLLPKEYRATLQLSIKDGQKHLLAKDSSGVTLFDGPVQTEAQRKKVPEPILEKLRRMEKLIDVKVEIKGFKLRREAS